jgi:hypothetical protein
VSGRSGTLLLHYGIYVHTARSCSAVPVRTRYAVPNKRHVSFASFHGGPQGVRATKFRENRENSMSLLDAAIIFTVHVRLAAGLVHFFADGDKSIFVV